MKETKIKKYIEDELKGFNDYYTLYLEYEDNNISQQFLGMAIDEHKHSKVWLDLAKLLDLKGLEKYIFEYEQNEILLNGGGEQW